MEIGERITVMRGIELCEHYQLDYLVDRILGHPAQYRSFVFDGCSGIDDSRVLKWIFGDKWRIITYHCCLIHDLQYAYGDITDGAERRYADKSFYKCLKRKAKIEGWVAYIFYLAVSLFGSHFFGARFSWGFADKEVLL